MSAVNIFYCLLLLLFSLASAISVTNDGPQVIFLTPSCQFVINLYVQSNYTGYKPFVDLALPTILQFQSVSSNIGGTFFVFSLLWISIAALTSIKTPLLANQFGVHPLTGAQVCSSLAHFRCVD